jgi:DNA-binding GntR family transcriptional regulator
MPMDWAGNGAAMKRTERPRGGLATEIADAIRQGQFRSGEWLRQVDLEGKFGATRFDVRAALEELVVRQTIEHVPNRGYRVAMPDEATRVAVDEVRRILECATAPAIIARIDDADLRRLHALAAEFAEAVRAGTHADQSRTNRAFHRLLYSLCGNPILEETIWWLRDRSRPTPLTIWSSHEALLRSERDHAAMLEAIARRDAADLAGIIARHIVGDRR